MAAFWLLGGGTGCPEDKRPLQASCSDGSQCASGLCLSGRCLEPVADADLDGLSNEVEARLGTDPLSDDTDGDGIADADEVGDVNAPANADGSGDHDALESATSDRDSDCLADQFDADDVSPASPEALGAVVCPRVGACGGQGALVRATCDLLGGRPAFDCDYSAVPGWQPDETLCDGVDNDCDGEVDEPFTDGSVPFEGGPLAADAGKSLGESCGAGACAGGTVVCDPADPTSLTCSTGGQAIAERCGGGDDDCDGQPDEGGAGLDGCSDFFVDLDGDGYGGQDSLCLCAADATYSVAIGGDCDDAVVGGAAFNPDAAPLCGQDADCDTRLLDAGEPCDDGDDERGDGCHDCAITPWAAASAAADTYVSAPWSTVLAGGALVLVWESGDDLDGVLLRPDDSESGPSPSILPDPIYQNEAPTRPRLAALEGGGFVMVWEEYAGDSVLFAQRYTASGELDGTPIAVLDAPGGWNHRVAATADDGFVVVWSGWGGGRAEVRVRFFDGDGVPLGPSRAPDAGTLSQHEPRIVRLKSGASVMAWQRADSEASGRAVMMQRYGADGAPVGGLFNLATSPGEVPRDVALAPLADDAWMLFLVADLPDAGRGVFAQRFTAAGDPDGARVTLEADADDIVWWNLAAAGLGGAAMVAWGDMQQLEVPVRAWIVAPADGAPTEVVIQDPLLFSEATSVNAAAGDGFFLTSFLGALTGSDPYRIYVQRLEPDGTKLYR